MKDIHAVWRQVIDSLYTKMISAHYNAFINPLIPIKVDNQTIYINAVTKMIKNVVQSKYEEPIADALEQITGQVYNVMFLDPKDPLFDLIMNDQEIEESGQVSLSKTTEEEEMPFSASSVESPIYSANLNPRYTFSNFVKGKSNDFALAVASSVADEPGTNYNPLFIYGASGLGKTHLMQAIGHAILERQPQTKVLYITSENFMNEFIQTITDSKNSVVNSQKFRDKYRNCDVLMIDDIQFIAGKEGTQEEIFHTFNSLRESKKQIILTSDKMPKDIKNLEERLVTRFEGGIMADIQQPDFETRVAILNHKIKMDRIADVPNQVIEFVADNITSSIRELEGAIIKVMAYYNLRYKNNPNVSDEDFLQIAKEALAIEEKEKKEITLELIKETVAKYYGISIADIISPSRQQNIARPRQVAMYLSRRLTNLSLISIANSFNRDHTTVMHGHDKIESLMAGDLAFTKEVEQIEQKIKED